MGWFMLVGWGYEGVHSDGRGVVSAEVGNTWLSRMNQDLGSLGSKLRSIKCLSSPASWRDRLRSGSGSVGLLVFRLYMSF